MSKPHQCITPVQYSAWYSWFCPTCDQEWVFGDPNHMPTTAFDVNVEGPPTRVPRRERTVVDLVRHVYQCRRKVCQLCPFYNELIAQLLEGGAS